MFDDGLIDMKNSEKDEKNRELDSVVTNDGVLGGQKGVHAPGVAIHLPGNSEKDTHDIRFGLEHGINFIAASFVRKQTDVLDIRELLEEKNALNDSIFQ